MLRRFQIPFLSGIPFDVTWKRDFEIDRADIVGCTPENELGRWHQICETIFASAAQTITFTLTESVDELQGYERPRTSVALETPQGRILADFIPISTLRSDLDREIESSDTRRIVQNGDRLECEAKSPKIQQSTIAVTWTLRNSESGFVWTLDADTLPTSALVGSTSVECTRRLFDGVLFRKMGTQAETASFQIEKPRQETVPGKDNPIGLARDTTLVGLNLFASEWTLRCHRASHSQEKQIGSRQDSSDFIPTKNEFGRPIQCPEDGGNPVAQTLDGSFLQIAAPSLITIPETTDELSIPLELLAPRYAKPGSWECSSSLPQFRCTIKRTDDPFRPQVSLITDAPLPERGTITISTNVAIGEKRYPVSRILVVTGKKEAIKGGSIPSLSLAINRIQPQLYECNVPPGKRALTHLLWFENGTELIGFRGLPRIPFKNGQKKNVLLACFALLSEQARLWVGSAELEIRPDSPGFLDPPQALLLGESKLEMNLPFKGSPEETVTARCSIVDQNGERLRSGLCEINPHAPQGMHIIIPENVVRALRSRAGEFKDERKQANASLFLLIELSTRQKAYSTTIPLFVTRSERRPEVVAATVYREQETSYCLFVLQDAERNHLTATVQWLDDPDRVEFFSTFPRENFSQLVPFESSDFPWGQAERRLLGRAALKTNARSPSCTVTVSDGILFARTRANQASTAAEAQRLVASTVASAANLDVQIESSQTAAVPRGEGKQPAPTPTNHPTALRVGEFGFAEKPSTTGSLIELVSRRDGVTATPQNDCSNWFSALRTGFWPSSLMLDVTQSASDSADSPSTPLQTDNSPQPLHLSLCSVRPSTHRE
jgi:hypothetical protein